MPDTPPLTAPLLPTAERLLSAAWAGDVRLGDVETLRDDRCYRVLVAEAPTGTPASVIVKKACTEPGLPTDPDATTGNPAQPLLEEWAGLEFLNSFLPETDLVPQFYGGDRAACLVVLEDLGRGDTLIDTLRGTDPEAARESLLLQAHALAQLHAHTHGHEGRYWQIRDALGPREVPRDWKRYGNLLATQGWGDLRALQPELQKAFDLLGQSVPPAFWDEYDALVATFATPSPFRTYVQNDSCPDNTFLEPGRARLIDFERGGFHLCLLDAAYGRLSMPHCYWANRLPEAVIPLMERTYRAVLAQSVSEAADDTLFGNAMTEACAYWILSNGMWMVHRDFEKDFNWGSATWRQRVFQRLAQFAATAEEFTHLSAMGDAARETLRRLKTHGTCEPMPLFPAFRESA